MSCASKDEVVVATGDLSAQDVFHVSAKTAAVDADGNPLLALNCDELRTAYDTSCLSATTSYSEFARAVEAEANAGAAPMFAPATALNDQFLDSAAAQRILSIRICIRFRWVKIYIRWRI